MLKRTFKSTISIILASILLFSCCSITASAKTIIKNITVEPITVCQGIDSYSESEWDWETGEYIGEYEVYYYNERVRYTIEWSDGTTETYVGYNYFEHDGEWGFADFYDDQSFYTSWETGNTYTAVLSIMDYEVEFPVTVKENPVESLEIIEYPYDMEYVLGEIVNPNGMVLGVNYKDGTADEILLDNLDLWGYNYIYVDSLDRELELYLGAYTLYYEDKGYTLDFAGKELEVPVNSEKVYPTDIAISGKGIDLNMDVTFMGGKKKNLEILGFAPWYGDGDDGYAVTTGALYTDMGAFVVNVYNYTDDNSFNLEMELKKNGGNQMISSNKLDDEDCQWWMFQEKANCFASAIAEQTLDVLSFDGEVTADNIDELLSIACYAESICWDESNYNDVTDDGYIFYDDVVIASFENVFGFTPDLKLSKYYNKARGTVEVKINEYVYYYCSYPFEVENTTDGMYVTVETNYGVIVMCLDDMFNIVSFEFAEETDTVIGDVNGDGVLSIIDATEIQKHLAGIVELTDSQLDLADVNGDDVVSIMDATDIQKVLVGLA